MSGGLFGSGGGRELAQQAQVPFLGALAADAAICEASDAGRAYDGTQAQIYAQIASNI